MAEFSTEATLSIILPGRETASIRSELEDALSDIPVGVESGSVGQGAGGTQGGGSVRAIELGLLRQTLVAQRASADFDEERNEILDDILDELESGGVGGGGRLLPFAAGAAAGGGGGGLGGFLGGLGGGALASMGGSFLRRSAGTALIPGVFGRGGVRGEGEEFAIEQQQESLSEFLGIETPVFTQEDFEELLPELQAPSQDQVLEFLFGDPFNIRPEQNDGGGGGFNFESGGTDFGPFQPDRPDQTQFEIQRREQTRTERLGEASLAIDAMQTDVEIREDRLDRRGFLEEVESGINNEMNSWASDVEREFQRRTGINVDISWNGISLTR